MIRYLQASGHPHRPSISTFLLGCVGILSILFLNACAGEDPCPLSEWYQDSDQDGFGNPDISVLSCEQPEGFVSNSDDGDDTEYCPPHLAISWYEDQDNDGLGNPNQAVFACQQPEGFVLNPNDQDDTQPCTPRSWHQDQDGDGLGNPNASIFTCSPPEGYVDNQDDEDDSSFGTGEVLIHRPELTYDGYVLLNELGRDNIRMIDKEGARIATWDLGAGNSLGNDAELLHDGTFLATQKVLPAPLTQGGFGGKIALYNTEKQLTWEYILSSKEALQHHDAEMLPNGNILVMAWEQKATSEILAKGYIGEHTTLNTEAIYEINPNTDEIVWEWHAWDHLIQDQDPTKEDFGALSSHPQRINVNYVKDQVGFMHANGIDYDAARDLIFISVRYYSEIWVIDHNTTTQEAKGEKGDLVYRFGNPEAYGGEGPRLFYRQHYPNLLEGNIPGEGNVLVFSNTHYADYAAVVEIALPSPLTLGVLPTVVWEFSDPQLSSAILSGAERLPNGNTLIAVGTQGSVWEVTPDKEVAWMFQGKGVSEGGPPRRMWRAYSYAKDSPAIQAITQ